MLVFVVTNQAGIARGYYDEAQFQAFTDWMLQRFEAQGAHIAKVYHCPHHPVSGLGEHLRACDLPQARAWHAAGRAGCLRGGHVPLGELATRPRICRPRRGWHPAAPVLPP
ncbi:hypothetical protein ACU4GD_15790 [Cupriavidus basilensis]